MVNVLTFLNIKIIDVDEKLRARNFLIANLISYTRLKIDSVEVIYKKLHGYARFLIQNLQCECCLVNT